MIVNGCVVDFEKVVDTKSIQVYRQDTHLYLRKGGIDYKFNIKELINKRKINVKNINNKYITYEVCNYD